MGTTREELSEWFDEGVKKGATHMIVACDTFNHEDFPVYVMPVDPTSPLKADVHSCVKEYHNPEKMLQVMEVYALHLDKTKQLEENRAYHLESSEKLPVTQPVREGDFPAFDAALREALGPSEE